MPIHFRLIDFNKLIVIRCFAENRLKISFCFGAAVTFAIIRIIATVVIVALLMKISKTKLTFTNYSICCVEHVHLQLICTQCLFRAQITHIHAISIQFNSRQIIITRITTKLNQLIVSNDYYGALETLTNQSLLVLDSP